MAWLLDHIQIIIVVASAIAYWLNQRHREKQGLPADYDEDGKPENRPAQTAYDPASMEAEEAERTRRLMEELRRKRAERSGEPLAPLASEPARLPKPPIVVAPARRFENPPPVFQDPLADMMKDIARRYSQQPEPAPTGIDQEMLARQRELEEKVRQLDAQKGAALKRASEIRKTAALRAEYVPHSDLTGGLVGSLRDPASLRKAILLSEILGKPLALR